MNLIVTSVKFMPAKSMFRLAKIKLSMKSPRRETTVYVLLIIQIQMKQLLFILFCVMVSCTNTSTKSSPFKGEWEQETTEEFKLLKIDLYEKSIKLPDESGSCYGYLQTENEFVADYWIIDDVIKIDKDSANVQVYSWRYGAPEDKAIRVLLYNSKDHSMTIKQEGYSFTLPAINSDQESQSDIKD